MPRSGCGDVVETTVRGQGEELRVTLSNLPDDIDVAAHKLNSPERLG